MWLTYRKNFPSLFESTHISDTGWGCMIRVGQMLLASALRKYYCTFYSKEPEITSIISSKSDDWHRFPRRWRRQRIIDKLLNTEDCEDWQYGVQNTSWCLVDTKQYRLHRWAASQHEPTERIWTTKNHCLQQQYAILRTDPIKNGLQAMSL